MRKRLQWHSVAFLSTVVCSGAAFGAIEPTKPSPADDGIVHLEPDVPEYIPSGQPDPRITEPPTVAAWQLARLRRLVTRLPASWSLLDPHTVLRESSDPAARVSASRSRW